MKYRVGDRVVVIYPKDGNLQGIHQKLFMASVYNRVHIVNSIAFGGLGVILDMDMKENINVVRYKEWLVTTEMVKPFTREVVNLYAV